MIDSKVSSEEVRFPNYDHSWRRPKEKKIESLDTNKTVAPKKESMQYTGDKLAGIATMHKSNAVPITKDSEMLVDISKMRR